MSLADKINKILQENRSFLFASSVFIAASAFDYFMTTDGIDKGLVREGHFVGKSYINLFGFRDGLLISKLIFSGLVISGLKCLDYKHKLGETKLKAEDIFYPGALLTGITGLSWLVQKYFLG